MKLETNVHCFARHKHLNSSVWKITSLLCGKVEDERNFNTTKKSKNWMIFCDEKFRGFVSHASLTARNGEPLLQLNFQLATRRWEWLWAVMCFATKERTLIRFEAIIQSVTGAFLWGRVSWVFRWKSSRERQIICRYNCTRTRKLCLHQEAT